jgi:hypothetical protein
VRFLTALQMRSLSIPLEPSFWLACGLFGFASQTTATVTILAVPCCHATFQVCCYSNMLPVKNMLPFKHAASQTCCHLNMLSLTHAGIKTCYHSNMLPLRTCCHSSMLPVCCLRHATMLSPTTTCRGRPLLVGNATVVVADMSTCNSPPSTPHSALPRALLSR